MIDLHSHILPGVDDGARSLEQTLAMCRIAAGDGVRAIAATPHDGDGRFVNPPARVLGMVKKLNQILVKQGIALRVAAGTEVHFRSGLGGLVKKGGVLTYGDMRKYLLLEMPAYSFSMEALRQEIFGLKLAGTTPVIAHAERNAYFRQDPERLSEVVRMGGLVQITANSLVGRFGSECRDFAELLLRRAMAHMIVSDAHSDRTRSPVLSRALHRAAEILGDEAAARALVSDTPRRILKGEEVVAAEPVPARSGKGFLSRLFGR